MKNERISLYMLKNFLANKKHVYILGAVSSVSFIFAVFTTFDIMQIANKLPDKGIIKGYKPDQTTQIFDINNKLIANIHGDEDRVVVPLNKISPYVQRAVIAIEDNRFYTHNGIDIVGTFRAIFKNFLGKEDSMQGGSTLTQQLAKNSFLSPERSVNRKIVEAIIALRLERVFDKNKILEMYLNRIYWGNRAFGIEKASKRYFKKPAENLDLAESSMLAGLIKAPEGYSPYTNYKSAKKRQSLVLERMEHYGYITHPQRVKAQHEKLNFSAPSYSYSKYPYFIDYVSYLLRKNYGDDIVRRGGLKVYTTLDPQVQEIAEKTINKGVAKLIGSTGVKQGALVSIKVDTGYIQSLVGGINYEKSNYNRAVFSKRAAGSSFKPVVYLTGFRRGIITPDSPIVDAPISFNTGWNIWSPHNWDGKYMGKMTIRKALTLSRNTPTVRISLKVGVDSIIQTARLLGIKSSIDRNFSIVLGSLGISPLEMATAYSTLARYGSYIEPTAIRKIVDNQGNILEENTPSPVQVVSKGFVKELDSILVDVVEKGTGKAAILPHRQVAGKTGTTDNVRDIWFTGFTPDTVTTIWLGNDQNLPLKGVFSSNCSELWGKFSKEYYELKQIPAKKIIGEDRVVIKVKPLVKKEENKSDKLIKAAKKEDENKLAKTTKLKDEKSKNSINKNKLIKKEKEQEKDNIHKSKFTKKVKAEKSNLLIDKSKKNKIVINKPTKESHDKILVHPKDKTTKQVKKTNKIVKNIRPKQTKNSSSVILELRPKISDPNTDNNENRINNPIE